MKDVNGCPVTNAEGKQIVHYLNSLNIIAYNQHLEKEHKKWTPPASLPWGTQASASKKAETSNKKTAKK